MGQTLTTDEAARIAQPFYNSFASGDIASLDAVFDSDWKDNTLPPNRPQGLTGLRGAIVFLRGILPDLTATIEDLRADGDLILVRIVFRGTNLGGLPGVPANGRNIFFIAFDWHRVQGGRIIESWHLEDNLSLMVQLGAIPPFV